MLDTVWTHCQNYWDEIPQETLRSVGKSALISFSVTLLVTTRGFSTFIKPDGVIEFAQPAAAAVIAGTATLIQALMTPFFNAVFGDREVKFERELLKMVVNITCTYLVLKNVSELKTYLPMLLFNRTFPLNVFLAELDLAPRLIDLFDKTRGNAVREDFFKVLGVNVDKDAPGAYYTFIF